MSEKSTDWIVPGAKVLVFSDTPPGYSRGIRTATIEKVAKKSFTVEGEHVRFSIDRQEYRPTNSWTASARCVVPLDSDEAKSEMAAAESRSRVIAARSAVKEWERNRTRENRVAAIKALQAIDDD